MSRTAGLTGFALWVAILLLVAGVGLPMESRAVGLDTSDVRVVQPGAPGEPTAVVRAEEIPRPTRIVKPGRPGHPSQVLTRRAPAERETVRVVRPGAPGNQSRVETDRRQAESGQRPYTEADVRFVQNMILHHAQALQMTALVPDRTDARPLRRMAARMERSQADEIAAMRQWLERRGEEVPSELASMRRAIDTLQANGRVPTSYGPHEMRGMLSPQQLQSLADASGDDFDRLFLKFMTFHHEGALAMVENLMSSSAGGQETHIFSLASHIEASQRLEIGRMQALLRQQY